MRIGERPIGRAHPPYIIAEIGVNHDGSTQRALQLVEAAQRAGADAVKVQYFEASALMSSACRLAQYQQQAGETDPIEMLRGLELNQDAMVEIVRYAHSLELHAIVTIFSLAHVSMASELDWDALKTASPDIVNLPLLKSLANAGKPMILSTGAANAEEIAAALSRCGDVVLHCVSAYPTEDAQAQLAGIVALSELADSVRQSPSQIVVGYSDHTTSAETGAYAVAAGAAVLEKHLTWSRTARGPDHAASLDPAQFERYVIEAHRAWTMLGERRVMVQPIEEDVRTVSRQSVTTARALPAGNLLASGDLLLKRPGTGLPPALLPLLPGIRLVRAVAADMPLMAEDLERVPECTDD